MTISKLPALGLAISLTLLPAGLQPVGAAKKGPDPCGKGSGGAAVAYRGKTVVKVRRAPDACLYRTGFNAAEPTLGITEDGSIFVVGLDAETWPVFPSHTIRSQDGGLTWEDVTPSVAGTPLHSYSEDPYLYVDPATSRIFTMEFLLPCSEMSYSDDLGESWTTTVMGCDVQDHQTLFAGPPVLSPTPLYPNVVYYCAIDGGVAEISTLSTCEKSLNGGLTFTRTGTPAYVVDPTQEGNDGIPGNCTGAHGHGVAGPDGGVYLPRGFCGQPYLAISNDEGATWARVQVADNGMAFTADGMGTDHEAGVAVDAEGNLYYTWIAADHLPYLAVSSDGGATWSEPIAVSPPGIEAAGLPGIDVGDPGRVAILYMGTTDSPVQDGRPAPDAQTLWNGYLTISSNALAKRPLFYTGAVNDPKDPIIMGACGPERCQAAYDFLDVVVGPDGAAWGVYSDGCFEGSCHHDGPALPNFGEAILGRFDGGPKLRESGGVARQR
ncbi:MAG: sialidase family protein [Actinomycetota bacterium]